MPESHEVDYAIDSRSCPRIEWHQRQGKIIFACPCRFFFAIDKTNNLSSDLYVLQLKYAHIGLPVSGIITIFIIDNI